MALDIDMESWREVAAALPPAGVVLLAGLVCLGTVLWLLGRRLARPACVVSGLILSGAAGYLIARSLAEQGAYMLPLVVGAGIAGALLSGLLFRVWMAVGSAIILALCVPAATIVWQGTPAPEVATPPVTASSAEAGAPSETESASPRRAAAESPPASKMGDESAGSASKAETGGETAGLIEGIRGTVEAAYGRQMETIRVWWEELEEESRWAIRLTALIGAAAGLLLGLIAPYTAAAVQTALAGSLLIYLPGRALLARYAPDTATWLPETARATLLMLGLITLIGVLLQWAMFRSRPRK